MSEFKVGDKVRIRLVVPPPSDSRVRALQVDRAIGKIREITPGAALPIQVEWSHIIEVFRDDELQLVNKFERGQKLITARVDFATDGSEMSVEDFDDEALKDVWRTPEYFMSKHKVSHLIQVIQPDALRKPGFFVGIFEVYQEQAP